MRPSLSNFLALLLAAIPAGAPAQTYTVRRVGTVTSRGYDDVRVSKAALAGQQIRVWWASLLNPDCTPAGTMTTRIVEPPHHGTVTISDDPFFPNFVEPNPRTACDTKRAPGKQAFYTAAPDYHGHDRAVLENATSEGRIRRIVIDLEVR